MRPTEKLTKEEQLELAKAEHLEADVRLEEAMEMLMDTQVRVQYRGKSQLASSSSSAKLKISNIPSSSCSKAPSSGPVATL